MQYADGKYHVREDLYMWDSVGELIGHDFATADPTYSQLTFGNFKEININNSYISADGIDVYSGTMSDDAERQAAALAVLRLNSGIPPAKVATMPAVALQIPPCPSPPRLR